MVPTVLQTLINKYIEIGIFINMLDHVYWFNGKRFEIFCKNEKFTKFIYYKNILYGKEGSSIHCYKFSHFTWQNVTAYYPLSLNLFVHNRQLVHPFIIEITQMGSPYTDSFIADSWILYDYAYQKIRYLPIKIHKWAGMHARIYKNYLFVFSMWENEKYDIQNKKWISFAKHNIRNYNDVLQTVLFNHIFYLLSTDRCIGTYDPNTDMWLN